jgi:hypothetical protein
VIQGGEWQSLSAAASCVCVYYTRNGKAHCNFELACFHPSHYILNETGTSPFSSKLVAETTVPSSTRLGNRVFNRKIYTFTQTHVTAPISKDESNSSSELCDDVNQSETRKTYTAARRSSLLFHQITSLYK